MLCLLLLVLPFLLGEASEEVLVDLTRVCFALFVSPRKTRWIWPWEWPWALLYR